MAFGEIISWENELMSCLPAVEMLDQNLYGVKYCGEDRLLAFGWLGS